LQFARDAQKLVNETRKHRHPPLLFHTFDNVASWQDFVVTTFADASGINRPKHGRTGGLLVCFAGPDILTETTTKLSIIGWKSWRMERVCIDTNSAEVQAMSVAEGLAYKIRMLWSLIHGAGSTLSQLADERQVVNNAERAVSHVRHLMATDSKGGYDAVVRNESADLGLKNPRTGTEAYQLKLQFDKEENTLVWMDGSWNLSDAFTKEKADCREPLARFLTKWAWRVKFDPNFIVSQKKAPKAVRVLAEEAQRNARYLATPILPCTGYGLLRSTGENSQ
jgi:hypothetical protein